MPEGFAKGPGGCRIGCPPVFRRYLAITFSFVIPMAVHITLRLALLLPLLAGCYVYRPVGTAVPPAGHQLRLTLTDAGTATLAPQLGPSVVAVNGKLIEDSTDAYVLSVVETQKRNGIEMSWLGEQVSISTSVVSTVQRREFSRSRTALVTAGTIVGILAARAAFWGPGSVFGGPKPGPGPGPR